ncbi:hypothetical protein H7F53_08530 [Novosphingobium piscinae]|uniref:DUF4440 domain-containing protein n=1 Tax=Novosphingobium piscinae TaxID=1507448 RepID=A0A7X1FZF5_9SPHN|nr:hypothetical protein [Novosphingobium piscinae]MBC2669187.1 hypothetical protein [Novosphingobium piscinae]
MADGAAAQERRGPPPGEQPGGPPGGRTSYANPSAVIAAELAFARDAQARGQWTAFAAAAAPEAVMFVPRMVWAQQWLLGRPNPPAAVRWQPHAVWSSCDGSLMLSRGAWQAGAGGASGWFTTLWQRQPDGAYRWVLDHGDSAAAPLPEPEMISAQIADCPPRAVRPVAGVAGGAPPRGGPARSAKPPKPPKPPKPRDLPPLDPAQRSGAAGDGSLRWQVAVDPDGARTLTVTWTKDGREQVLQVDRVAAPAAAG